MSNSIRIIKNSVFEIATYGARAVSLFFVPVLLARLAGADLLGEYVVVINLAMVFVFIADFGLPRLLTREISRQREDKHQVTRLVNASLGVVLVLSLISLTLLITVSVWMGFSAILLRAVFLSGIAIGLESMMLVIIASFRGTEAMEWSWVSRFSAEMVFLVLLIIVIPVNTRVDWLMAAFLMSRIVSLSVAAVLYWPRFGKLGLLLDMALFRSLIKNGFPFAINNAMAFIRSRLGVIILAYLTSSVVIALLEVATSLTVRLNVISRAVNDSLFPFLSFQYVKDGRSLRKYTTSGINFLLVPGFFFATLIWVYSDEIVSLVYGEEFLGAVPALKWLAPLIPLRFITYSLGTALTASNRQKERSITVTVAAVTSVVLNFILIPQFQLIGVVIAMIFTEAVLFGHTIWYLRSEVGEMIDWRSFIGPALGAIMILLGSILFNTLNTWLLLFLSAVLYLFANLGVNRSSIAPLHLRFNKKRI